MEKDYYVLRGFHKPNFFTLFANGQFNDNYSKTMIIMEIFSNSQKCIQYAKLTISKYPFLEEIIDKHDCDLWVKKALQRDNFNPYLVNSNINILNSILFYGYCIDNNIEKPVTHYYKGILDKLSLFLTVFPELTSEKNFKSKIKNIEGLNFLSTLSELSLAYQLKKKEVSI